ncbi:MAG: 50S ribosomal protein L25 [Chloroflexota bacterium]|nr:50S ribosomal protein L25 [Chloroflexota bacterium]
MPEEFLLTAEPRTVRGKQVSQLRRAGSVPAILYGSHIQTPLPLKIEEKTLKQIISKAGHNRLIKLNVDSGAARLVLAREVQRNPLTGRIIHVDFQEVSMTEKLTTPVPLVLVGTSPAVTRGDGLLIHGINTVEIRVLPGDLIPQIEVDVSGLLELNQSLYVKDLKVGEKIEILTPGDEMVAKVVPVKEEVIAVEAPVATAEVEVIKKGKIEEEGIEGEAPAAGAEAKEAKESKKEEKK